MPNDITVTKITTSGSEKWDVAYFVDASGTKTKTLNTAGTLLDRNIQVSVTTPAGSATVAGGGLSVGSNYTGTPTVSIALDSQTTSGITINDTQPSSGYYLKLTGSSSALSGTTQVNRAAITLARTAGWVTAQSATNVSNSTNSKPTVTVNSGSKTRYLAIPTATFTTSGATVYCSGAGWVPAGSASNGIGTVSAGTITNNTTLPSGSTSSGSLNYQKYIKISAGYYPSDLYYYNGVGAISGSIGGSASAGSATAVLTNTNDINTINDISGKTAGTDYWTIKATATTSAGSYTPKYTVTTAGYLGSTVTGTAQTVSVTADSTGTSIYIPKATYSTSAGVTTITTAGYLPANTKVTNITTQTPTTSYANSGLSTYFNAGSSSDYNVSITPRYSNSAGYVAAHTNTNNGGIGYWKIKTTSIAQGTSTIASGATSTTRGTATWGTGWITTGSIDAATFANTATNGVTYLDISNTTDSPMLISGDYLYINKGYTDNLKISLAKLVPDWASGTNVAGSGQMLSGYKAYDQEGGILTGTIQSLAGGNKYATTSDQTISCSGKYMTSNIVIKKLTSTNYSAANIKHGVTITVNNSNTNVYSVEGTFTKANTVSSGQTAATAAKILSGYSAWVDGAEVKGTIGTGSGITFSGATATAAAGYYAEAVSATMGNAAGSIGISGTTTKQPSITRSAVGIDGVTDAASGAATTTAPTSGVYVKVSSAANTGTLTATETISTAGYAATGTFNTKTATVGASASAATYVPITTATPAFDGGAINGSVTGITGSNVTLSDTDNGISVTGAASAGRKAVLYNGAVNGWVSKADNDTALSATSSDTALTSKTRYITAITVPNTTSFTLTTAAGSSSTGENNYITTVTNNSYRTMNLVNKGWLNIDHTTNAGKVTINAYLAGGTTKSGAQIVVSSSGNWKITTVTPNVSGDNMGPYYGAVYVKPMSGGTAAAATVTGSGTATSPTIAKSGTAISGATASGNIGSGTITTTAPSSGFYVATVATAPVTTLTMTKTVNTAGYLGANSQITASAATTAKTGSVYYVPVTSGVYSADSSASSNSTVTPSVAINNASTYGFTTTTPTSGTNGTDYLTIDPGASATAWSVTPRANITTAGYIPTGSKTGTAVSNTPSVAAGTNYYVPIVTPSFSGGALNNKAASATFASNVTSATTDDYNNGLSVLAKGTAGRAAVTYTNSAGVIAAHSGTNASSAVSASTWNGTTYYLKGVKIAAPSSGTAKFDITVPNGNTTDFITFQFQVDSSGNVTVMGPD